MQGSSRLSIALPTFNRAAFLEVSIDAHAAMASDAGVSIMISDNASTDDTRAVVKRYQETAPNVKYYRNEHTITPDENFEKVLGYSNSEYVWLLGDTYRIPEATFKAVLRATEEDDYDLIVVNASGRVKEIENQVFEEPNELLANLGWHMTCLSTLVYSRRLLKEANFVRYRDTNFLQTGIIFEYLADRPLRVKWIPGHSVLGLKVPGVKKTSWEDQTFEIWTKRWANFVFSLPASYSLDSKLKCAMDHGLKSGVFTLSALKRLRKKNILDGDVCRRFAAYFPLTIHYPAVLIRLIAVLPSWLFRVF
jgi:glycosyltransferase involved in cell wall biosynthesis